MSGRVGAIDALSLDLLHTYENDRAPQIIGMREILSSDEYVNTTARLPIAVGTTIANDVYVADLAKAPHLLVAGATGTGKSVALNCIMASLLYKLPPSELKFVLIDPKMVQFSTYSCIRSHYLATLPAEEDPIVTEPLRAVDTLNALVKEMELRYALLKKARKRSIEEYNAGIIDCSLSPADDSRFMPYIVAIIDEFADLMMTVGEEFETPLVRLASKARAVGIHLIIATQRPSADVITGVIKANFPMRMAFAVRQAEDSRTILGCTGAEQLIGRGDMLISVGDKLDRVQCAFIDTDEVESMCHSISDRTDYNEPYELPLPGVESHASNGDNVDDTTEDGEERKRLAETRKEIAEKNRERMREFLIAMDRERKESLKLMRRRHTYYSKLISDAEVRTAKEFYDRYKDHFKMYGIELSLGETSCSIYLELGDYDYEQYWVMDGKNGKLAEVSPEVAYKEWFSNVEVNIFTEEEV